MGSTKRTIIALAAATVLAAAGCGGDEGGNGPSGGSGSAGTAGKGGSAGATGGSAGTAGKGGSAGATGGSAGTAGQGGSAGTAGQGGSAGTAGQGGSAGTAGQGGSAGTAGQGGSAGATGGSAGTAGEGGSAGATGGSAGTAGEGGSAGATGGSAGTGGTVIDDAGPEAGDSGPEAGDAGPQCTTPSNCPLPPNECVTATCTAGVCGTEFVAAQIAISTQVAGDCHRKACDGAGNVVDNVDNTDIPDDGNPCTTDTCTNGTASHPVKAPGTNCGGSNVCDANGQCVGCLQASDCGLTTACKTFSCTSGACGSNNTASGTVIANPVVGDCSSDQCDGNGAITVNAVDDTDKPADDGNQCTDEICTSGVPSHPAKPLGTSCNQTGGTVCDGLGTCVAPPVVSSVSPNDTASPPTLAQANTAVAVTFSQPMNPATLTAQTAVGACTGSIQVSVNGFASCVGFATAAPVMSSGNATATLVPAPGLLINRSYKVRVTTAAANASGLQLAATYTSPVGFDTNNPLLNNNTGVVISQVYAGGGNSGAKYKNDFIELHNRGVTAVNVAGWSVQYAGATGTGTWTPTNLTGTIQPGGYYLIQEAMGAGGTDALPTPNATGTIAMAATAGKVALVNTTTALSGACPTGAQIVDMVGYGSTANCSETAPTAAPSNTAAVLRSLTGCVDNNNNAADFTVGAPTPRNDMSSAYLCAPARNEAGTAVEVAYCDTQFPLSLSVQTGTTSPLVYGQIYQPGVTEAAGSNPSVSAQLGYEPATSNPEYEMGWVWLATTYNVQSGNNDEYQASFTAPAAGSYRYVYRFSLDGGASWTYCDNNQGDSGSGSNSGLSFDFENEAVLTVTP